MTIVFTVGVSTSGFASIVGALAGCTIGEVGASTDDEGSNIATGLSLTVADVGSLPVVS